MSPTLALLLCAAIPAVDPPDNLDFSTGKLTGWQGQGFVVRQVKDGDLSFVATSKDGEKAGGYCLIHRTFEVPRGVGTISFTAHAVSPDDEPSPELDVLLEEAGRKFVPKLVRADDGFKKCGPLLPAVNGKSREYVWPVADRQGDTVRIIVLDRNPRDGAYVACGGFRMEPLDQFETRELTRFMTGLVNKHKLGHVNTPLRTSHFLAIGNADDGFIRSRLAECEQMHGNFLHHFRTKGFKLKVPGNRLAVAVFDSPKGLDAYMGREMPAFITGIYHPESNRLVVYDYGRNKMLLEGRERAMERLKEARSDLERAHLLGQIDRATDDARADANLATVLHEVSHQMSFNTGMLNRDGDAPLWLVEGLATYCEPTEKGQWKGIGAMNLDRVRQLARVQKEGEGFVPLKALVQSDRWFQEGPRQALAGYAQSWALFRMLMEEEPKAVRTYCELIWSRRTAEHRLTDFGEAFGADLAKLERRHREYIKRLVDGER